MKLQRLVQLTPFYRDPCPSYQNPAVLNSSLFLHFFSFSLRCFKASPRHYTSLETLTQVCLAERAKRKEREALLYQNKKRVTHPWVSSNTYFIYNSPQLFKNFTVDKGWVILIYFRLIHVLVLWIFLTIHSCICFKKFSPFSILFLLLKIFADLF